MGRLINIFLMLVLILAKESVSLIAENEDVSGRISTFRSDNTSTDDKTAIAAKGETVVLQCNFSVSGWFTVQWLKFQGEEGVPVALLGCIASRNGSLSTATLTNINETDVGNYSCVLSSLSGSSNTYNFLLVVKDERSCENSTCSPNGYCSELKEGYNCTCKPGFIGNDCEFEDPCLDSPCQHNGKCIANSGGEFSCRCARGYGGTLCESEVCISNICGSGGTCRVKEGRVICNCPYNKAGNRCQHRCQFNYPYNVRNYCRREKTCKISSNYYRSEQCVCDSNRRSGGTRCMMESDVTNECNDPNICNGRGTCYNQVFRYRCECTSYSSGTNCEFLDECRSSNLCSVYGGTCVDLVDGYKCTNCPEGQHGDKCQYKKNPCKVTCYGNSMRAECDLRFLSKKMENIPVYLNEKVESCRLHGSYRTFRRITVDYRSCGTEIEYGDDHVVYRNYLHVGNSEKVDNSFDSIITRAVGHFKFKMECILPLARNATAELADMSLLSNETMDLQDRQNIAVSGTNIQFYSGNYSRPISKYIVGDRLLVKMTINEGNNPTLSHGYKLHAVTCFATPERKGNNERYMLLSDGCVMDESFRFENEPDSDSSEREVYFSFDSFSFKSIPGQLYLHCTSLACNFPKGGSASREDCDVTCKNSDLSREIPTTASAIFATVAAHDNIDRLSGESVDIFSTKPV